MTTTTQTGTAPTLGGPRWRRAAVLVTVTGPLAVAVLRGILPYDTTDDTPTILAEVAAHPAATDAVLWLELLALFTLPLGVLIVGRLAIRTRPVLGLAAATVAWIGYVSLFGVTFPENLARATSVTSAPIDTVTALVNAIDTHPSAIAAVILFVVGHITGGILLGVALWPAIPKVAAAALIVSGPLHLVFALVAPNHLLDAGAWALTAAGMASAAGIGGQRPS